jgi:broad specificity phosphatase PhoE
MITFTGIHQCGNLVTELENSGIIGRRRVAAILSSPLQRALNTADHTFSAYLDLKRKPNHDVTALAELQETFSLPCDTGTPLDQLRGLFIVRPVDFSGVANDWPSKSGIFGNRIDQIKRRAKYMRQILFESWEGCEVVIVSHGRFLHFFTEDWEGSTSAGSGWQECELRTYTFSKVVDPHGNGHAEDDVKLVETEESRTRRGANGPRLTEGEQRTQEASTLVGWTAAGYVTP